MTKIFEIGKTYTTRSACDHDCMFAFTIISRTAKRITIEDRHGNISTVGVKVWADNETAMPFGRYSMAPVINAERIEGR